jgi:hypothetical protein
MMTHQRRHIRRSKRGKLFVAGRRSTLYEEILLPVWRVQDGAFFLDEKFAARYAKKNGLRYKKDYIKFPFWGLGWR